MQPENNPEQSVMDRSNKVHKTMLEPDNSSSEPSLLLPRPRSNSEVLTELKPQLEAADLIPSKKTEQSPGGPSLKDLTFEKFYRTDTANIFMSIMGHENKIFSHVVEPRNHRLDNH